MKHEQNASHLEIVRNSEMTRKNISPSPRTSAHQKSPLKNMGSFSDFYGIALPVKCVLYNNQRNYNHPYNSIYNFTLSISGTVF